VTRHGIDVVTLPTAEAAGNARTGVPFSLPLSRSSRSRHTIDSIGGAVAADAARRDGRSHPEALRGD
jgi:hypothetical protein